jgi:organic hydroperoxide reductase OsmC/OhrA
MAHEHKATVSWTRGTALFTDNKYSRGHTWSFDGGVTVPASSSPSVVRLPLSRADAVDPEEAFVAALSSCHMLFFLHHAALKGFVVDTYVDEAAGVMAKNEKDKMFVKKVTLRPRIVFSSDKRPSEADIADLHHRSHADCFIANSVLTEVVVEPVAAGTA